MPQIRDFLGFSQIFYRKSVFFGYWESPTHLKIFFAILRYRRSGQAAGVGVGMLSGDGFFGFLVFGFLVAQFLGFKVSRFQSLLVQSFLVSDFKSFLVSKSQ